MEVEIKVPIGEFFLEEDPHNYITNKIGTHFEELIQTDRYFQSPIKDFHETDEALRIRLIESREKSKVVEVTYKGPKIGNKLKIREELTFSTEQYSDVLAIFEKLGYTIVAEIKKKRTNWRKDLIMLSLDEVKGLGTYIEAEMIVSKNTTEISKGKDIILEFLRSIFPRWSGKEDRRSYLELLIRKM